MQLITTFWFSHFFIEKSGFGQAILPKTDILVKSGPQKSTMSLSKRVNKVVKMAILDPFLAILDPLFHPLTGLARPVKIAPRKPRDISYLISPFCHYGKRGI